MTYRIGSIFELLCRRKGSAAFIGAYDDIPNIVAAYGMRRLRTAYTGSILRIRESGGNTELDIGALGGIAIWNDGKRRVYAPGWGVHRGVGADYSKRRRVDAA